jgi:hypothetical protein
MFLFFFETCHFEPLYTWNNWLLQKEKVHQNLDGPQIGSTAELIVHFKVKRNLIFSLQLNKFKLFKEQ